MRRDERQRRAWRTSALAGRSLGRPVGVAALAVTLSGCILGTERPNIALDIPSFYRAAPKGTVVEAALPKLEWWRSFRSRELSTLMEAADVGNLDIAAAVARIVQADAQARITGAALLPNVDLNANATRTRSSQANSSGGTIVTNDGTVVTSGGGGGQSERVSYRASLAASYELDFWGKNRAALRSQEELAIAARFDREVVALQHTGERGKHLFPGAVGAGPPAHRQREPAQRERASSISSSSVSPSARHRRSISRSRRAWSRCSAPRSRRSTSSSARTSRRSACCSAGRRNSSRCAAAAISAVAIPRVTPGLPSQLLTQRPDIRAGRGQPGLGECQRRECARRLLPDHPAHRRGRHHQHGAEHPVHAAGDLLLRRRQPHAADLRWRLRSRRSSICSAGGRKSCCRSIARRSSRRSAMSSAR